jgi:hypothetical protein
VNFAKIIRQKNGGFENGKQKILAGKGYFAFSGRFNRGGWTRFKRLKFVIKPLKIGGFKMSKKHFIKLAKIFAKYNLDFNAGQGKEILWDIVQLCQEENPNFDQERFLKACGVNS